MGSRRWTLLRGEELGVSAASEGHPEHPWLARLRANRKALGKLRAAVEPLEGPRPARAWMETTRAVIDRGLFGVAEE